MSLTLTITLGDLLIAGTCIVSVFAAYAKIDKRLALVEEKVSDLWRAREERRAGDYS